ncbi:hypothetical protein BDQ17DRAFT_1331656 [Cyathus striatus]|nr:hypothetical protein BDQ17DRAFT_1331656 [Cyathus striatus]
MLSSYPQSSFDHTHAATVETEESDSDSSTHSCGSGAPYSVVVASCINHVKKQLEIYKENCKDFKKFLDHHVTFDGPPNCGGMTGTIEDFLEKFVPSDASLLISDATLEIKLTKLAKDIPAGRWTRSRRLKAALFNGSQEGFTSSKIITFHDKYSQTLLKSASSDQDKPDVFGLYPGHSHISSNQRWTQYCITVEVNNGPGLGDANDLNSQHYSYRDKIETSIARLLSDGNKLLSSSLMCYAKKSIGCVLGRKLTYTNLSGLNSIDLASFKSRKITDDTNSDENTPYFDTYGLTFGPPLYHSSEIFSHATVATNLLVEVHGYLARKSSDPESAFYKTIQQRYADLKSNPEFDWIHKIYDHRNVNPSSIPGLADHYGYLDLSAMNDIHKPESHFVACSCRVLHRNISVGNILKFAAPDGFVGFLDNFYNAALVPCNFEFNNTDEETSHSLKEIAGTHLFMATHPLTRSGEQPVMHKPHQDLESFYWVLVWILLRHAQHDRSDGNNACKNLFIHDDNVITSGCKFVWIVQEKLTIKGNIPLTALLEDLRQLFRQYKLSEDPSWPNNDGKYEYQGPDRFY